MSAVVFPICWREESFPGSSHLPIDAKSSGPHKLQIKLELLEQLFFKTRNHKWTQSEKDAFGGFFIEQ